MKNSKFAIWWAPFVQSIQRFRWKSTEVSSLMVCLMTLKSDAEFEKNWLLVPKLTIGSKNDMRNLVKFSATSGKSENLHFDVLLLSIAYKVSAKNLQKNYLSWNSRVIQTLKKKWIFVWKMAWGIWSVFKPAVESLKTCTLMCYFYRNYVMFELKKIQRSCLVKNDLWFPKWHEEFGEFSHK